VTPRLELNFPNPINSSSDLFDRDAELVLIQDTLRSPARRPIVIMGERVMGKTSLLNVALEWSKLEPQFSVQTLPHVISRDTFMEEILDGMAAEAGTTLFRLGLRNAQGQFCMPTITEFVRVAGELSAGVPGKTFLLCLEELDSMLVNCPDDASANQILGFILHVIDKTSLPIKFIFTLTRMAPQILHSDASQFMSSARIAFLAPWTPDEVRAFVARLLQGTCTFDENAHQLLFAAGGGHPYLTKALLHTLREMDRPAAPDAVVTVDDLRDAIDAAVKSTAVDFTLDNIVTAHFTVEELGVLRQLAFGTGTVNAAEIDGPPGVVHGLLQRRYLRADDAGRYTQAFGLLGEWLRRRPWPGGRQPETTARPMAVPHHEAAGDLPVLLIDDGRGRVFLGADEVALTAQEYRFLNFLVAHAGSVIDRYTIATEVWPDEVLMDGIREGRLDALVYRLREELGGKASKHIETRRGRGYYVSPDVVRRIPRTTT